MPKDAGASDSALAAAWEQRYSPDQPRAPAGSSEGGQWTSGGDGGSSGGAGDEYALTVDPNVANDAGGLIEPAQQSDLIDLRDEEYGDHNGHTIRDHVGKSETQLTRETEASRRSFGAIGIWKDRIGSFPSLDAANKLVNSTLAQNQEIVASVAGGNKGGATIEAWFNSPTGYESYAKSFRSQVEIRDTWGVRVVITHDAKSTRGFRIFTAFPINVSE